MVAQGSLGWAGSWWATAVGDSHPLRPPAILDGKRGEKCWKEMFSVPITLFWKCDVTFPKMPGQVPPGVDIIPSRPALCWQPHLLPAWQVSQPRENQLFLLGRAQMLWIRDAVVTQDSETLCYLPFPPHHSLAHPGADFEAAGSQLWCSQSCGPTRRASGTLSQLLFLAQNPRFPGNLQMSDRQLDEAGENDVNNL